MGMQLWAPRVPYIPLFRVFIMQQSSKGEGQVSIIWDQTDSESLKVEPRHLWFKKHLIHLIPQLTHAKFQGPPLFHTVGSLYPLLLHSQIQPATHPNLQKQNPWIQNTSCNALLYISLECAKILVWCRAGQWGMDNPGTKPPGMLRKDL